MGEGGEEGGVKPVGWGEGYQCQSEGKETKEEGGGLGSGEVDSTCQS